MKNFLQSLLIFFSLCLCVLIAFQWVRETDLRKEVQALTDDVQNKKENIMNLESRVGRNEREIQRLDGIRVSLTGEVNTNKDQIAALKVSLEKSNNEKDRWEKTAEEYRKVVEKANESITAQNNAIKKQNEDMQKMVDERNAVVTKYNSLAKEYKDLVDKWNKQQEDLAKTATNTAAPPKK